MKKIVSYLMPLVVTLVSISASADPHKITIYRNLSSTECFYKGRTIQSLARGDNGAVEASYYRGVCTIESGLPGHSYWFQENYPLVSQLAAPYLEDVVDLDLSEMEESVIELPIE